MKVYVLTHASSDCTVLAQYVPKLFVKVDDAKKSLKDDYNKYARYEENCEIDEDELHAYVVCEQEDVIHKFDITEVEI